MNSFVAYVQKLGTPDVKNGVEKASVTFVANRTDNPEFTSEKKFQLYLETALELVPGQRFQFDNAKLGDMTQVVKTEKDEEGNILSKTPMFHKIKPGSPKGTKPDPFMLASLSPDGGNVAIKRLTTDWSEAFRNAFAPADVV